MLLDLYVQLLDTARKSVGTDALDENAKHAIRGRIDELVQESGKGDESVERIEGEQKE